MAGVHMRIMHNAARRQSKDFPVCRGNFRHGLARQYASVRDQSLLWAVLRDPTSRAISQFFHFHVSRGKVEPTDANFQHGLLIGGEPTSPRVALGADNRPTVPLQRIVSNASNPYYISQLSLDNTRAVMDSPGT